MCIGVIVSLLNNAEEFIQVDFLILNIVRVCSSLTTVPDTIGCSHTIYSATITIITVNEGAIGFQSRDCLWIVGRLVWYMLAVNIGSGAALVITARFAVKIILRFDQ